MRRGRRDRVRASSRRERAIACTTFAGVALAAVFDSSAEAQTNRTVADAVTVASRRCLDERALEARTVELLGADAVDPTISVEIEEREGDVQLRVQRAREVVGERTLELGDRSCAESAEAVALALASALDGRLASEQPVPSDVAPLPAPEPAPAPRARPPARPAPASPARRPTRSVPASTGVEVAIATELGVAAALLPEPALAVAPAVELSLTRGFDLRASALFTTVPRVDLEDGSTSAGQADVGLGAGRLDACLGVRNVAAFRLRGCGGAVVGVVHAEGQGVPNARSGTAPWVAASLRGDARYEIGAGFGLGWAVEGFAVLARAELAASEAAAAPSVTLAPGGATLLAGPFYRF